MNDRRPTASNGFALIEVLVMCLLIVPTLNLLMSVFKTASHAFSANDANSDASRRSKTIALRVADALRMASYRSVQVDVGGTWVSPVDGTPYEKMRFRSLAWMPTNAATLGEQRAVEFRLDPTEAKNAVDDDADGLVDEGTLQFVLGTGESVQIADEVE